MRRHLTALLCWIALVPPVAGQAVDTVRLTLTAEGVEVRQRLLPEGDEVKAHALAMEGQTLDVVEVVREGESLLDATLVRGERDYEITVESGAPIVLRYRLSGDVERLPLFVAGGSAELTVAREVEAPFLLRLEGPPDQVALIDPGTSLPRWRRAADGALEVRLSSLPSLVRLSRGGLFSFQRITDLLVVLAIVVGAWWAWRYALLRRRGKDGSRPDPDPPLS